MAKFPFGRFQISRAFCDQALVEMRHGKRRIQVNRGLIMALRAVPVGCMFSAQRHQIVGTGVQFVKIKEVEADPLRFAQVAAIRE